MPEKTKIKSLEERIVETERRLIKTEKQLLKKSRRNMRRIPLLVPVLGSFGLVSMFYGFEKILDKSLFADNPIALILIGLALIILTGAAIQKL